MPLWRCPPDGHLICSVGGVESLSIHSSVSCRTGQKSHSGKWGKCRPKNGAMFLPSEVEDEGCVQGGWHTKFRLTHNSTCNRKTSRAIWAAKIKWCFNDNVTDCGWHRGRNSGQVSVWFEDGCRRDLGPMLPLRKHTRKLERFPTTLSESEKGLALQPSKLLLSITGPRESHSHS